MPSRTRAAKATLARSVRRERDIECCIIEVRPEGVCEVELGVSERPQEKVADVLFAARTDQKIGFWRDSHRQVLRDELTDGLELPVDKPGAIYTYSV